MVLRNVTGRVSKAELLCVNKADSRVRKKEVKIEADKDVSDTRIMKFVTKALFDDMRDRKIFRHCREMPDDEGILASRQLQQTQRKG